MNVRPRHTIPGRTLLPPALSEVMPGLFIGRRPDSYIGYGLVASCEQHLARKPMKGYEGLTLHVPMRDEDDYRLQPGFIMRAAEKVLADWERGERVLVHCTGGLNRSGLLVAEVLKLTGMSGREAVEHLRRRHDPYVLCNRQFERFVTGEQLPTAETSAFRSDADA